MQISTRRQGDISIVDVTGDITLYHSPDLRKTLLDLIKTQHIPFVIVNMTAVKYIDSAGVASLIEGLKAARELKSRFALFGLSRVAREVLELTRLLKVFEVYEDESQAVVSKPATS
jgi:anti-sigma B factor antagonist